MTVYGAGNPPGAAPNVIGGTGLPSGSNSGSGNAKGAAGGGLQQMSPATGNNSGQPQGPGLVVIPR